MTYYIYIQNEILNGCGQCRQLTEGVTNLEVDESLYNAFVESPNMYIWDGSDVVIDPDYEEKQAQKERERLDKLSMTRGDVFEALILARGLTKPQIRAMIENAELDDITKALYLNRFDEALDFYRGFPVFNMLGKKLGVTPKQLDMFFINKDYHYLTNITLKINTTPSEAVVTINGVETKEFSTPYQPNLQLPVTYSVACEGYVTKEDEIVLTENTVLDVVLKKEQPTEPAEVETSVVEESSESV